MSDKGFYWSKIAGYWDANKDVDGILDWADLADKDIATLRAENKALKNRACNCERINKNWVFCPFHGSKFQEVSDE